MPSSIVRCPPDVVCRSMGAFPTPHRAVPRKSGIFPPSHSPSCWIAPYGSLGTSTRFRRPLIIIMAERHWLRRHFLWLRIMCYQRWCSVCSAHKLSVSLSLSTGAIPTEFRNLRVLEILDLFENHLSGERIAFIILIMVIHMVYIY